MSEVTLDRQIQDFSPCEVVQDKSESKLTSKSSTTDPRQGQSVWELIFNLKLTKTNYSIKSRHIQAKSSSQNLSRKVKVNQDTSQLRQVWVQVSNQQRHHLSFSCLQSQISAHVETRSQGQSLWGTHVHHVSSQAVLQYVFNCHCRNNLPLSSSLTLLCEFALGPTLKAAAAVTETVSHLVTSISYQGNVTGSVRLLTQQEDTTKQLIISAAAEEKGFISGCKNAVIVYQACLFTPQHPPSFRSE